MAPDNDRLTNEILAIISNFHGPLETKEIAGLLMKNKVKETTRIKVMWRLQNLRGEGKIKGKMVGGGKGVWIWWLNGAEND